MSKNTMPRPEVKSRTIKPACLESCSCLSQPIYACVIQPAGVEGVVEINGDTYTLIPLGEGTRDGYRLVNTDSGSIYDIDTSNGWPVCDCPDFVARRGRTGPRDQCKHGLALIALRRERQI
jgi:hypothetical protein